jgi:hypothetical protein
VVASLASHKTGFFTFQQISGSSNQSRYCCFRFSSSSLLLLLAPFLAPSVGSGGSGDGSEGWRRLAQVA